VRLRTLSPRGKGRPGAVVREGLTLTQRLPRASSARLPALPQCTIGGVTKAGGVVPSSARLAPSRSRLAAANSMSVAMTNHRLDF
jgi:hypothetical protein